MSTLDTGPSAVKAAARATARARRRSAPRPDGTLIAERSWDLLQQVPGPRRVTAYASYGTEPPTVELCSMLAERGFEVLLPRVADDRIEWVLADESMEVSAMGIAEPTGPVLDLEPVRALLIPALAVTPAGDRLGKGGGFYDRVLAGLGDPRPIVAAIVDDGDVIDDVPVEPHDYRVDYVITPTRVIACATRRG